MSSPTWSSATLLVEAPDSPSYKSSEAGVFKTQIYHGVFTQCEASRVYYGHSGTGANLGYLCDSCIVTRDRGGRGRLEIVWKLWSSAGGGGSPIPQLPQDEFSVTPNDTAPRLERHPFFDGLSAVQKRKATQAATESFPTDELRQAAYDALPALGKELFNAIANGQEAFFYPEWSYVWTSYHWYLPSCTMGGMIQTPGGPMMGRLGTIQWLRLADQVTSQNGTYCLTRSWRGALSWDSRFYAAA